MDIYYNGNYPERYRNLSANYYFDEQSDRITHFQLLPTTLNYQERKKVEGANKIEMASVTLL
jgi:hypothetical protein